MTSVPEGPFGGGGKVAVHGESSEEEDAGVHVGVVEEMGELAEEDPPQPGVFQQDVHLPERDDQNHTQVGQGQVEDVEVEGAVLGSP